MSEPNRPREAPTSCGADEHRTVRFTPEDQVFSVRPGEAVLAALQRCGFTHAYGCRRGGCGRCKIKVVEGAVRDGATISTTVLTPDERAEGWCLSCRSIPETDLLVRLQPDDRLKCLFPWGAPTTTDPAKPDQRST